jgi:hypothetical protein
MARARWSWLAPAALLACSISCAWLPFGTRAIPDCEGPIASTDAIEGDFILQQRLRVRTDDLDFPLRVVLQKRDGELALIGINPFGAKLFTLVQRGMETEVDALPPAALAVPPLNLLRDLHRVLFLSAPPPASGEGESVGALAAEEIVELWSGGAIVSREFLSEGRAPVRLEFSREEGRQRVLLQNPHCGYRLELHSISAQTL